MLRLTAVVAALLLTAQANAATVERLYVLDCGWALGKDQARWSPGVNEGKPIELRDNCYLIQHAKGWMLWDTGIPDNVAGQKDGVPVANGAIVYHRDKTLKAQLEELKVPPDQVTYVGISHTHGDHVGNVALFPASTILMQGAEYDWAMAGPNKPAFAAEQKIDKLAGDRDVFGDGSVVVLSTPGHTPGHQSLLVMLPKRGAVILSGDLAHFKDNWDNKRVPSMNTDKDASAASMRRVETLLAERKAELWINHDKAQSESLPHAPAAIE